MRNRLVICEICGGERPSGSQDFLVFHCLAICSPDCLEEYRTGDEARRAGQAEAAAAKHDRAA